MTKFEFAMMIASVVVAVGMTEIVGGWGRMARTSAHVKFDWLHFGWTLVILLWLIQYWIGMFTYVDFQIDYVIEVQFLVIPTLFGVLAAFAITPEMPREGSFDMRAFFWEKRSVAFASLVVFSLLAATADFIIIGFDDRAIQNLLAHGVLAVIMTTMIFTRRIAAHAAALCLVVFFFVVMAFSTIQVAG